MSRSPLADLAGGAAPALPRRQGRGPARAAERCRSSTAPEQEDFPAAAADAQGRGLGRLRRPPPRGPEVLEPLTERPKSFADFVPKEGGDQVRLLRFPTARPATPRRRHRHRARRLAARRRRRRRRRGRRRLVREPRRQLGPVPAGATIPAEQSWSEPKRLTTNPGTDTARRPGRPRPTARSGWPGKAGSTARPTSSLAPVDGAAAPINVSDRPANEWSPRHRRRPGRAGPRRLRQLPGGQLRRLPPHPAADGTLGRGWSPWPTRPVRGAAEPGGRPPRAASGSPTRSGPRNWGKDAENLVRRARARRSTAPAPCGSAASTAAGCSTPPTRSPTRPRPLQRDEQLSPGWPATARAGSGSLFRHRQEAVWATSCWCRRGLGRVRDLRSPGRAWAPPQRPAPERRPARQPPGARRPARRPGPGLLQHRRPAAREVERTPELSRKYWLVAGRPPAGRQRPVVAALTARRPRAVEPTRRPDAAERAGRAVHPDEAADIARMRAHRVEAGGKTYQLLRGEFHRHTEISWDGGSDGSLEDMWRYAIDAAGLDWIGNGDHDNGGGKEYTWWLIQKTTDLYHVPPAFTAACSPTSGASATRTATATSCSPSAASARCRGWSPRRAGPASTASGRRHQDALRLPEGARRHLRLAHQRHRHGHRLARQRPAGRADRRDLPGRTATPTSTWAPPRGPATRAEAIGGCQPLRAWSGTPWRMQYKLGFQSSSDHVSTHISYGVALAEEHDPRGDPRRLQEAALLRRDRQHPARRPLAATT